MDDSIKVSVTTSMPLKGGLKAQVDGFIADKTDGKPQIEYIVDSGIIGGIVIEIGDVIYDGSIKSRTDVFKRKF